MQLLAAFDVTLSVSGYVAVNINCSFVHLYFCLLRTFSAFFSKWLCISSNTVTMWWGLILVLKPKLRYEIPVGLWTVTLNIGIRNNQIARHQHSRHNFCQGWGVVDHVRTFIWFDHHAKVTPPPKKKKNGGSIGRGTRPLG